MLRVESIASPTRLQRKAEPRLRRGKSPEPRCRGASLSHGYGAVLGQFARAEPQLFIPGESAARRLFADARPTRTGPRPGRRRQRQRTSSELLVPNCSPLGATITVAWWT